jgi:putative membrane protein
MDDVVVVVLVLLVALLHAGFLVLEMFLFSTPRGRAVFGTTPEEAATMRTLAANQGLYNGLLAAGLVWGLVADDEQMLVAFLTFVVIAGIYGAATVSRRILVLQAAPAAAALVAVAVT